MAIQRGKDLLLKLDDGNGGFVTVAGLRSRRLSFSTDAVDVTSGDSPERWRELLSGAGVRRAHVSGSGIFRDAGSDELVRAVFFTGAVRTWRVVLPDFGVVEGPFLVVGLDFSGAHDGEMTFELTLESAGALAFTVV